MSYRDLRNFTEMMRALGYTRIVSMENFRSPNFPLVAETLAWLAERFDPDADVPTDTSTEQARVALVRSIAQLMASKAHIRLNTKRLYQADGYAVKELLKVATVLYDALRVNLAEMADDVTLPSQVDLMPKAGDLRQARQLASQITEKGATLHELLSREADMREARGSCADRPLEMEEVERGLREALDTAGEDIASTRRLLGGVSANEQSLDGKIEKKRAELERNRNRLLTLKKVRPAFLEEFERLEAELQQLYGEYLVRFRCLSYLQLQQDETEAAEQRRVAERQETTRQFLEQLRQEDRPAEGAGVPPGADPRDEADQGDKAGAAGKASRVRIKTASGVMRRASAGQAQRRVFGSMAPPEDEDSGSLDSDSDLLLDDDGSELLGSEEEDELEPGPAGDQRASRSGLALSDDDF
ncbi:clusterin-associated protein 1 isoform X1 [Bacillus rossius redtenbacheri]|uniref:clusterin-associated protein 1 isoform X1 n=1 Tax=Bacillus rossius redtenbacheri TaxID=93214 RepID=UPI002FDD8B3A